MNNETTLKKALPEVTREGMLYMQVCIPAEWTDTQIETFANAQNPSGTTHGWAIRREGDALLDGDPERVPCAERGGFVHVMLDC